MKVYNIIAREISVFQGISFSIKGLPSVSKLHRIAHLESCSHTNVYGKCLRD